MNVIKSMLSTDTIRKSDHSVWDSLRMHRIYLFILSVAKFHSVCASTSASNDRKAHTASQPAGVDGGQQFANPQEPAKVLRTFSKSMLICLQPPASS